MNILFVIVSINDNVQDNDVPKEDIAYLFHVALQKLAFLPFSYVMDSWR